MQPRIRLQDWLRGIREELRAAAAAYQMDGAPAPTFLFKQFTIEVQLAVEKSSVGEGKLEFWVIKLGSSEATKDVLTHKLSLQFNPLQEIPLGDDQ
jgi:hypothetical protein